MSLMKTLAKVAIGVAVAKGASAMMNRGTAGTTPAGLGGLLGGLQGGAGGADIQNMLGGLLSGAGGAGGGLGGLLEGLGGAQGGGLQSMLGGLAAGGGAAGLMGALGDMAQRPADNGASFGQVLNSQFDETPEPVIEPTADQEAAAALMLRAMVQAAKSDGKLDKAEEDKLIQNLGGDIDADEATFLRAEMAKPVDAAALAAEVPQGLGPQVYAMSLLAINLDNQTEAQYLHALAQGLGLDATSVNDIHAQLGVPSLYA